MNKRIGTEEVFLATTALEEFWDVNVPIVILGPWCLLYQRRHYWSALNIRLLRSFGNGSGSVAYDYINRIYERLLPLLGECLNSIHGKKYSDRYWRILIGPWLQMYLFTVHDRFNLVKDALSQYPNCTTLGLSEESFFVPRDTLDYACALQEDIYNLQLYTKILSFLGKDFRRKEFNAPENILYAKLHNRSWKQKSIEMTAKLYSGVCSRFQDSVLLHGTHFSFLTLLKLTVNNFGKILPSFSQMVPMEAFEINNKLRTELRSITVAEGDFGRCLSSMIADDIPQCFIEGYHAVEVGARAGFPKQTKAIFSANGWYYDECFKHWAATCAEKGTRLLGTQHGGNYGIEEIVCSENHETAILEFYYSWGWGRAGCASRVIPMPASKLLGRKKLGADNTKDGILWVATSQPRYADAFQSFSPIAFLEYLNWQARFAKAISLDLVGKVRFRPHYVNHGWAVPERIGECIQDLVVERWDVPFQKSLENCRLYVCDHLSTTFAEALAANKPVVLFWNPEFIRVRPEAKPYFDLLKEVGILFETPEAAALEVRSVYGDVEGWWNDPRRQQAVREFCDNYARTDWNAIASWGRELERVSRLPLSPAISN